MNSEHRLTLYALSFCLFIVGLLFPSFSYGQCENRTELGSTVNVWDWRSETYDVWIKSNDQVINRVIPSPFYSESGEIHGNVQNLGIQSEPDYEPEDGWELLIRTMGTSAQPVADPFFILYNRYNSLMRLFVHIRAGEEALYKSANVVLGHSNAGNLEGGTALLQLQEPFIDGVESMDPSLKFQAINEYSRQGGTWLLLQTPLHYDPCVCNHLSALTHQTILGIISPIDLVIEGSSENFTLYDDRGSYAGENGFSATLGSIAGVVNDGALLFNSGNQTFENVNRITDWLEETVDPLDISFSPFVPDVLKDVPYSGTAITTLSRLIGGGSSLTSSPALMGFREEYGFITTGNIAQPQPYGSYIYYVPGCDTEGRIPGRIPTYDNPLGVFSVLDDPVVLYDQQDVFFNDQIPETDYVRKHIYQLSSDLNYAINSNIGLVSNPNKFRGALYFTIGDSLENLGDYVPEGLIPVPALGPYEYRTPFMPIGCLAAYPVVIKHKKLNEDGASQDIPLFRMPRPRLVISAIFDREDGLGDEVIYQVGYNLKVEEDESLRNARNGLLGIPEVREITWRQWRNGGNFRALNQVIVTDVPTSDTITQVPSGTVIKAPDITFMSADGEEVESDIVVDFTPYACTDILPMSQAEIRSFCRSRYDPSLLVPVTDRSQSDDPNRALTTDQSTILVYPNPASDMICLKLDEYNSNELEHLRIINFLGQDVTGMTSPMSTGCWDISKLPEGVYHIFTIDNEEGSLRRASFIKQ